MSSEEIATAHHPEVLEFLKYLGMPEDCIGARLDFTPGEPVTVHFERAITLNEIDSMRGALVAYVDEKGRQSYVSPVGAGEDLVLDLGEKLVGSE